MTNFEHIECENKLETLEQIIDNINNNYYLHVSIAMKSKVISVSRDFNTEKLSASMKYSTLKLSDSETDFNPVRIQEIDKLEPMENFRIIMSSHKNSSFLSTSIQFIETEKYPCSFILTLISKNE